MSKNRGKCASVRLRAMASIIAVFAAAWALAGCGGAPQVDKYTVTDADRQAALANSKSPAPANGGAGTSTGFQTIPKDSHDGAAYGPDGKPMGAGSGAAPR